MDGIGLVLEGGGMRGVYTSGVLEYFMEKGLMFPYVIGVSAGACNACSYISLQPGRNKKVTVDFVKDPRYLSYRNLIKEKSIFGMDFIFDEIPNNIIPFNFEAFYNSKQKFIIGTTDVQTGHPVYFEKDPSRDVLKLIRASSSLPFVADIVEIDGYKLLDGGIADPVPINKSIEDGNQKNVIILTQRKGYTKKPLKYKWLIKKFYKDYPGLLDILTRRHQIYNDTVELIEKLESEGKVFIIRPSSQFKVSRIEKKQRRLEELYHMGYNDSKSIYSQLIKWVEQ